MTVYTGTNNIFRVDVRRDPYTGKWFCHVWRMDKFGNTYRDNSSDAILDDRMSAIKKRDELLKGSARLERKQW